MSLVISGVQGFLI